MSYDPEHWLESATRELKSYVEANINTGIYSVVMEFPGSIVDADKLPMKKTIIHFEIDNIESSPVGFGDNVFNDNYDPATELVTPQAAEEHMINFDVGIWASDKSGGATSRLRARQLLRSLFGIEGIAKMRAATDGGDGGLEIISYSGGEFAIDTSANDVRLYRMINSMLVIRVYSRTLGTTVTPVQTIQEIDQAPNITIIG